MPQMCNSQAASIAPAADPLSTPKWKRASLCPVRRPPKGNLVHTCTIVLIHFHLTRCRDTRKFEIKQVCMHATFECLNSRNSSQLDIGCSDPNRSILLPRRLCVHNSLHLSPQASHGSPRVHQLTSNRGVYAPRKADDFPAALKVKLYSGLAASRVLESFKIADEQGFSVTCGQLCWCCRACGRGRGEFGLTRRLVSGHCCQMLPTVVRQHHFLIFPSCADQGSTEVPACDCL